MPNVGNPRVVWVKGNPRTVGTFAAPDPNLTCDRTPCPPGWVLDRLADRKLDGGYTPRMVKRTGVCPLCFTVRPVTGTCCGRDQ